MPAERDMSELVVQYMDENNMYCMEGHRGVRSFEKIATMLGYNDRFNTSTLHAFLEDNSGCLEAMVEWIKTQCNPEWKAAIESVIEELEDDETNDDSTPDINGDLENGEIVLENFAGNTLTFNKQR